MATYKVWLTVKDSQGNTKEIDGGTINVDLSTFTDKDAEHLKNVLPLDDFLKKSEITSELDAFATDQEVEDALHKNNSIRYADFEVTAD